MRWLFVKEALAWPRSSGHDVHCYHLMQALIDLGHDVALLTRRPTSAEAIAGLRLAHSATFAETPASYGPLALTKLQEKFRSYWGIELADIRAVGRQSDDWQADVVVVVGLNVLPYLGTVHRARRVWYAADEWLWHHWSQVRVLRPPTWSNLRLGLVKGLYERAYAGLLDRVWVVTRADRRAMRWVAGTNRLDILPNGVDAEHFAPRELPQRECTCTFWGRLDFGPNEQALEWFCRRVWPLLLQKKPEARFTVYGFQPTAVVRNLTAAPGIELVPDLPDLRNDVAGQAVVVLPFVSGGGIKNKLLEAAAMGKAIVCTPRACSGLDLPTPAPLRQCRSAHAFANAVLELWADASARHQLGQSARRWVSERHTWKAAACTAVAGLRSEERP